MCRLYGFRSQVLSGVHHSLVAADNALARQSVEHPDGWGVSYYHGRFPHVIRSDKQALDDRLFRDISALVSTRTLLAHVRQATVGGVGILNCHPFQHGPWTFGHNGEIAGFGRPDISGRIRDAVDPRFRSFILGETDSESVFYLFLSRLSRRVDDIYEGGVMLPVVLDAMRQTVELLLELGGDDASFAEEDRTKLTFLITNGNILVGHRFRRPLFYSTYKSRCPERDGCPAFEQSKCEQRVDRGSVKHLILTSEQVARNPNVWTELGDGEYVAVDYGMNFHHGKLGPGRGQVPA